MTEQIDLRALISIGAATAATPDYSGTTGLSGVSAFATLSGTVAELRIEGGP
jgi:hypothetical protein